MTITFPLALPTNVGITRVRFFKTSAVAINESPWTYAAQIQVHPGQRWGAEITLPVMDRDQAEVWECFLLQLNGIEGSFMLGDHLRTAPRGNWSGLPRVDGAGQIGNVINLNGFVEGATIEPGDKFQIDNRLYRYIGLTTAVADSSGEVTLDIFPRLRDNHANGTSIITDYPKGMFRLAANEHDLYESHAMEYFSVSLSCLEAL